MSFHRIAIKLPFERGVKINPSAIVPVFHRWIRERVPIEGMPIDVADYTHVHHGPAAILVAHEADYTIDLSDGVAGFTYTRKRPVEAELREDLIESLRRLLTAASALAEDPSPHGPVQYDTQSLRVAVLDKLRVPNTAETFERLKGEVERAFADAAPDTTAAIDRADDDARQPLGFAVTLSPAPTINELIDRLREAAAA